MVLFEVHMYTHWKCIRHTFRKMSGKVGLRKWWMFVKFNISQLKPATQSSVCHFLIKSTSDNMDFVLPWSSPLRISLTSNLTTWSPSPSFSLQYELYELPRSMLLLSSDLASLSARAKSKDWKSKDFLQCSTENSILHTLLTRHQSKRKSLAK